MDSVRKRWPPPWTTLFRFPFDHPDVSPGTAFREIGEQLERLGARTLLFLRNIKNVHWRINGQHRGIYSRDTSPLYGGTLAHLQSGPSGAGTTEDWLVFQRPVHRGGHTVRVEIAFQLRRVQPDSENGNASFEITRVSDPPLVVFFATEKRTGLGFLAQGPYRTTPARDNVPHQDDWNLALVNETAELLIDTMRALREQNLLNTVVLESLPIQSSRFPADSMFFPLFDRVRTASREEPFLPTADGGYCNAQQAVLAGTADLRELLSSDQLGQLIDCQLPLQWLRTDINRQKKTLRDYLTDVVGVRELSRDMLAQLLSGDFVAAQSDEWMVRLYAFLVHHENLWSPGIAARVEGVLRQKPILRLETGEHIAPFTPSGVPAAFLPTTCDVNVPFVKRTIADDHDAETFLRRLGLTEPDIVDEVINVVLPRYNHRGDPEQLDHQSYLSDLQAIASAFRTDSAMQRRRLVTLARTTPFLRARNAASGVLALRPPEVLYQHTDENGLYFAANREAWFLLDAEVRAVFRDTDLEEMGIARRPRLIPLTPNFSPAYKEQLRGHKKAASSKGETLVDYAIDGLPEALEHIASSSSDGMTVERARVVWNVVRHTGEGYRDGRYEWFYRYARESRFPSHFLQLLTTSAWLPDRTGQFHRPSELGVHEIPEEFELHDEMIARLGILRVEKEEEKQLHEEYAATLGVELSDIALLLEHSEAFARWKDEVVAATPQRPEFPERNSTNPARRMDHLSESVTEAPKKNYEKRERTVRVSGGVGQASELRMRYTNWAGQMICQICQQEMPFRKRNGEYHFESVELTPRVDIEHNGLYLALCPVCAAKYQEFVKNDPEALARLESQLCTSNSPSVQLCLGSETATLRFVETHWLDVMTLMGKCLA